MGKKEQPIIIGVDLARKGDVTVYRPGWEPIIKFVEKPNQPQHKRSKAK